MKLTENIKGFLKMTGHYADSAVYLAEHGYNEEYLRILSDRIDEAKKEKDRNEGIALLAQAHLFRGEFEKALSRFEETDFNKLPKHTDSVAVNNYILCLFLMKKFSRVKEIYEVYNKTALSEPTLVMRRTMGIREHIEKRYENAVTIFIKLLSEPDPRATLMADICLVRSLLALDMKDRAAEVAEMGFSRYNGKGDITSEVNKLRLKINEKNNKKTGGKKKKR